MKNISKLPEPRGRERFLTQEERIRLLQVCHSSSCKLLFPIVLLALSTGMRKAEILGLKWRDIQLDILPRCWFDEEKCANGISSLDNYKKEWNDRHGCWSSRPLHNFASHGADAFRMMAVGLSKLQVKVYLLKNGEV